MQNPAIDLDAPVPAPEQPNTYAEEMAAYAAAQLDECETSRSDVCPTCGEHIANPHAPGCAADTDPVPPVPAAPPARRKRERRPSAAQRPILSALVHCGGIAVTHGRIAEQLAARGTLGTWVAVVAAGWVKVDRGTPDNRGGRPADYRYTLTEAGWLAAGAEQAATGITPNGKPYAVARFADRLHVSFDGRDPVVGTSSLGPDGAAGAWSVMVETLAPGRAPDADALAMMARAAERTLARTGRV